MTTTQDLLYIVLSFAILWITIFFCWALYYVVVILRDIEQTTKQFRDKIMGLASALGFVQEKINGLSGSLGSVMDLLTRFVGKVVKNKLVDKMAEFSENNSFQKSSKKKK